MNYFFGSLLCFLLNEHKFFGFDKLYFNKEDKFFSLTICYRCNKINKIKEYEPNK